MIVQFPNSNVASERYDKHYDKRTAPINGHFSLAGAAGLRKYVYGNGSYFGNYPSKLQFSAKVFCKRSEIEIDPI